MINDKNMIKTVFKLKLDCLIFAANIPLMNNLQTLKTITRSTPLSVVMISSLMKAGAEGIIKVLGLGTVDFINKIREGIGYIDTISNEIINRDYAATVDLKTTKQYIDNNQLYLPKKISPLTSSHKLVAIGTSTGGPKALQQVITKLPADLPCGVVIVQHMPPGFTKSLAERLNQLSAVTVKEAENGDYIKPAHVYIAPGDYHMLVRREALGEVISLNQNPPIGNHRPSVNALFESVVPFGKSLVAVILTGMGNDGAEGMQHIKRANGYIIAEDKSTSVVYGMPKAVVDLGIADEVLPVDRIASAIVNAVKRN
ncbi:chemotaxis-specific protein-glutamate methyltransferase CheB [Pectinatus cerevisiiphilus]